MNKLYRRFIQKPFEEDMSNFRERFPNSYIHPDSYISTFVEIGDGTRINGPAYIQARRDAPVIVGKYLAIAHNLRVRARNHSTGYANMQERLQKDCGFKTYGELKGSIKLGHCSWIGDNVIVLPGVTVGEGAVIGAGSIVTKEVPPCSIAVGSAREGNSKTVQRTNN